MRQRIPLPDGTVTNFDLYLDPLVPDPLLENVILVLIPGISNHSESDYARAYIEYASSQGFKVACLNHLGRHLFVSSFNLVIKLYSSYYCCVLCRF